MKNKTIDPVYPTRKSERMGTPFLVLCVTGIAIACIILSAPASAGTKYMSGSPDLSAYISGTNEFSPGDSVSLPITIENTGLNEFKFIQSGIVDTDDQPNTAKFVTVSLASGDAPLVVKSDPQMVGDLRGSAKTTASFSVKILSDAPAGTYQLPLVLNYSYLYHADQYATDSVYYYYKNVEQEVIVPITIKPRVQIEVISAATEQVNAGTEGSVVITVKNTGHEDGKKTVLKISRNDASPVTPSQSSVYIGDFAAGQTISGTFRVSVSADAEEQTYPLDVFVSYEDREGDTVTSETDTVGIPVGKKVEFTITSGPVEITAGKEKVITVVYKNTGGATVYNALARISAVDPFTCSDDSAFLGTVAPGESREAMFEVSVDNSATAKEYGLDSEIRYRDSLDNSGISDPLKVIITVNERESAVASLAGNPLLVIFLVVLVLAGIGGYFFWYRKQDR